MKIAAQVIPNERDIAVLSMVYSYGGCTVGHLRRRFFPTDGGRSPCYRRIGKLLTAGYLKAIRLPSLTGKGSGKTFLTLGSEGRRVVATALGFARSALGRRRADAPGVIAHHLALADIRLDLEMATQLSDTFSLEDWLGDHETLIHAKDPETGELSVILPDSVFTLAFGNAGEQRFYIEMDMGTLAPKRVSAKPRAYLVAVHDPVLFIVPEEARVTSITNQALKEAKRLGADPTIFWLTRKDMLSERTILSSPIWKVAGGPQGLSLEGIARGARKGLEDKIRERPVYLKGRPSLGRRSA